MKILVVGGENGCPQKWKAILCIENIVVKIAVNYFSRVILSTLLLKLNAKAVNR
jgi:hypothetical protein